MEVRKVTHIGWMRHKAGRVGMLRGMFMSSFNFPAFNSVLDAK